MTKKTIRIPARPSGAGGTPGGPGADPDAWIGGPEGAAFAFGSGTAPAPEEAGERATGGPASVIGEAMERLARVRTPAEFAAFQIWFAGCSLQAGLLGAAFMTQTWADALRDGAALVGPRDGPSGEAGRPLRPRSEDT